jgi:hypothetical protein
MNEVEYILRVILKARDELATALKRAREELRLFVNAADSSTSKLEKFNSTMTQMDKNITNITQKMREWRQVIGGVGDDNAETSKSFGQLGKEVDQTVKKTTQATRTTKEYAQAAGRLRQEQKDLVKEYHNGNVEQDYTVKNLQRIGSELDKLSGKMRTGTRDSKRYFAWGQDAKAAAQQLIDAEKKIVDEREKDAARLKKIDDDIVKSRESAAKRQRDAVQRELLGQIADEERAGKARIKNAQDVSKALEREAIKREDIRSAEARAQAISQRIAGARGRRGSPLGDFDVAEARAVARELDRVAGTFRRGSDAARRFRGEAESLRTSLRRVQNEGRNTHPIFRALSQVFGSNGDSIATLDNKLRGLGLLLAAGFAQQLITVLVGLSGALVAVAGSAAEAGAALGGVFVAGIAQALPAIGLLAGALNGVKNVFAAVKQAQLERQQASVQGATADRRTADAADAVVKAQERLRDAQQGLTEAREKAKDQLVDLAAAERDAALAAAGAALDQEEAQKALLKAQATGDVEGIRRAQLAVLQARADSQKAREDQRRATRDAARGERGGVEGAPGVVDAKRQIDDAQRGLASAKRNAAEAAAGTETAAAKLNFLLANLTEGQRKLFDAVTKLQATYKKVFDPITDIIVGSFTRAVNRITDIIQMPKVIEEARKLATSISASINRIFDAFTGDKILNQFLEIAEAGRKNLAPITDIIIRIGRAFVNIAEAAGPAYSDFLKFISDLVDKFLELTENRKGLEDFFKTGEKHFEAWVNLALSVIRLFAALTGAGGAESGLGMVEDATKALDDLADKVHENREAVKKFFEDSRGVVDEVVGVVKALAIELFDAFKPDRIHDFADLLKRVIIPALGDAIDFAGQVTGILLHFADSDVGGKILKVGVAFFILTTALSSSVGALVNFVKNVGFLLKPIEILVKAIPGLEALAGVVGEMAGEILLAAAPWVALAAAVGFILYKLGLLDDLWRAVKDGFKAFWDEVRPSLEKLIKAFGELWDAVSDGKGLIGTLAAVLRPILRVIIQVGDIFMKVFGRMLGRVIGGAIDTLTGLIEILTGVFTGDWRKAWEGVKDVFSGAFRFFTATFRAFPEFVWEILKRVPRIVISISATLVRLFARMGSRAIHAFIDFIRDLPGMIRDFFRALPGRVERFFSRVVRAFGDFGSDAAKAFVDAFSDVGESILNAISSGVRGGTRFAANIVNGVFKLLEDGWNRTIGGKGIGKGPLRVEIPKLHLPRLAEGGRVGSGYGGGDRIQALLEAGEHVWSKEEVRAAGGHAAMYRMRKAYGGGGQSQGTNFQEGGAPSSGGLTITFVGGNMNDFAAAWRSFWNVITMATRRGANYVEDQFRDMRANTARSADRMYTQIRSSIADIQNSFKVRGAAIESNWSDLWYSLKKTAYDGLNYIGHQTNLALKGLDEKHINFGLTLPAKDGKAGGGWIGQKGQRGRDRGLYPLGAGEAVLNWQHQRYVEPAMHAYYGHGLGTMFGRVHGYHAGGPGQAGFAAGTPGHVPLGDTGRWVANSQLARTVLAMMKKWHFALTAAGEMGHAPNSDHHWGGALDIIPGAGGSWEMLDKLARAAGWRPNQPMPSGGPFRWIGWNTEAGHGAGNHLHLSWRRGGPFVGPGGIAGDAISEIGRLLVTGPGGALKTIVQAALDIVRKAANKKIDESGTFDIGNEVKLGPGGAAEKVFDFFTGHGLSDAIAAGFTGVFQKESGFSTTVGNKAGSGATGLAQWLGGRLAALQQKDNWQSLQTQLNFVWEELHGSESGAFAQILQAKSPEEAARIIDRAYERSDGLLAAPEYARQAFQRFAESHDHGKNSFARGGEVPGPRGAPVSILAHAREWVVNEAQQKRLAAMLGTSRSALRSMLGFHGSDYIAQGGLEVEDIAPLTTGQVRSIDPRSMRRLIVQLRAIGRAFDRASINIGSVGVWTNYLERTANQLDRVTSHITRRTRGKNLERVMMGFLDGIDKLVGEGGVFERLRTAIERRSAQFTRGQIRARFQVGAGRVITERTTEAQRATADLVESRRLRGDLTTERGGIADALEDVQKQLRRRGLSSAVKQRLRTQQNRLRAMLDDADERIAENMQDIFEKQVAEQQAAVDEITRRYERAGASNDVQQRIATALGNEDWLIQLTDARRTLLQNQMTELQGRIGAARAAGAEELAQQLEDQVADLNAQIVESVSQSIKDAVDRINATAQRRMGRLDLASRMLDAVGAVGLGGAAGLAGETFTRGGLFAQRAGVLATQRAGIQAQLGQASATGNIGLVKDLTDQLAELDVTIQENTKAYFDARVEDVNNRSGFALTMNDLDKQILELQGAIDGNTDQQAIIALLQQRDQILRQKQADLQTLLAEATPGSQQYNDLTIALKENQIAILQNTQAVNEATGAATTPQTFTSSAWSWFREAIFNGIGQVLPQYDIGGMASGINTGAVVTPSLATNTISRTSGDNVFNLYEAGRPVDLQEVSSVVTFASKTAQ